MTIDEINNMIVDLGQLTRETLIEVRKEIKSMREGLHELNRQIAEAATRRRKQSPLAKEGGRKRGEHTHGSNGRTRLVPRT